MRFLADDRLEGRETGSEGHRKAAAYVAAEFARAGLKPAGSDGYLQAVDLRSREIDEGQCSLSLVRPMGTDSLTLGEDAIISVRVDPAPVVNAELVFAGYGLAIPEADHDDFAGLDVRGKVVVALRGAPPSIPGPLAAHMQSSQSARALETPGCHRLRHDPESQEYGYSLGTPETAAVHARDEPGRSCDG